MQAKEQGNFGNRATRRGRGKSVRHEVKASSMFQGLLRGAQLWNTKRGPGFINMSESWVRSEIKAGRFPAPVRISEHSVAWRGHEASAWLEARGRVGAI